MTLLLVHLVNEYVKHERNSLEVQQKDVFKR